MFKLDYSKRTDQKSKPETYYKAVSNFTEELEGLGFKIKGYETVYESHHLTNVLTVPDAVTESKGVYRHFPTLNKVKGAGDNLLIKSLTYELKQDGIYDVLISIETLPKADVFGNSDRLYCYRVLQLRDDVPTGNRNPQTGRQMLKQSMHVLANPEQFPTGDVKSFLESLGVYLPKKVTYNQESLIQKPNQRFSKQGSNKLVN